MSTWPQMGHLITLSKDQESLQKTGRLRETRRGVMRHSPSSGCDRTTMRKVPLLDIYMRPAKEKEGGREESWKGGREKSWEGGWERGRKSGREGGREAGREAGWKGGRLGGRVTGSGDSRRVTRRKEKLVELGRRAWIAVGKYHHRVSYTSMILSKIITINKKAYTLALSQL